MKAEDKFDEKFKYSSSTIHLYKEEIITLMKEFAREKCKEQRENCANEIEDNYSLMHDHVKILNTKEPEL